MSELPLRSLFLTLVSQGFPLTARDLTDALRALRMGHGHGSRESLQRLCQALWARSTEERRRIELLFRDIPLPAGNELRSVGGGPESLAESDSGPEDETGDTSRPRARPRTQTPSLIFEPPGRAGLSVPRAAVPAGGSELFILIPSPFVSVRSMIIAWRRFRRGSRSGPRIEVDLDATITEQTRRGYLTEPVLIPARRNTAALLVFMDVSASMASWMPSAELLQESLDQGRLGESALFFFDNWPEQQVYRLETRHQPVPLDELLKQYAAAALLILSDAGSARGRFSGRRLDATARFLNHVGQNWRPVAWLNPMPESRWQGSTAAEVAALPEVSMFEWTEPGLIAAIDFLRGSKS